jgi:hypothetical protein
MTFIVINETQRTPAVVLMKSNSAWKNVPRGGILRIVFPGQATGFSSRAEARSFIDRTLNYDRLSPLGDNTYAIYRVRPFLNIK